MGRLFFQYRIKSAPLKGTTGTWNVLTEQSKIA